MLKANSSRLRMVCFFGCVSHGFTDEEDSLRGPVRSRGAWRMSSWFACSSMCIEARSIRPLWGGTEWMHFQFDLRLNSMQEGLKAHENGQHAANPFDIFQNFFGGRKFVFFALR